MKECEPNKHNWVGKLEIHKNGSKPISYRQCTICDKIERIA